MNDRIEELQEMKDEYILNETSLEIGQRSVSWGELADMQADAEARWNETDEGRELALLERGADELTVELYKALKASLHDIDELKRALADKIGSHRASIYYQLGQAAREALRKAEGE